MILKRTIGVGNSLRLPEIYMTSKRQIGQANMPGASGNLHDFEDNIAPNAKYLRLPEI